MQLRALLRELHTNDTWQSDSKEHRMSRKHRRFRSAPSIQELEIDSIQGRGLEVPLMTTICPGYMTTIERTLELGD